MSAVLPHTFSWRAVTAHPTTPPGRYAGDALDQHGHGWCGACYLVAAAQVVEDRASIARARREGRLAAAPPRISLQTLMDFHRERDVGGEWNTCRGGFSLHVFECLVDRTCPLVLEESAAAPAAGSAAAPVAPAGGRAWLGFPRRRERCPVPDAPLRPTRARRIAPAAVAREVHARGPVVLEINAQTLKSTDARGVVRDLTPRDPNHAVAVLGWTAAVDGGERCWIVRNSWGATVPTDLPTDLACVGWDRNECEVAREPWRSDPADPGVCYLPQRFAPLWETGVSPWVAVDVDA